MQNNNSSIISFNFSDVNDININNNKPSSNEVDNSIYFKHDENLHSLQELIQYDIPYFNDENNYLSFDYPNDSDNIISTSSLSSSLSSYYDLPSNSYFIDQSTEFPTSLENMSPPLYSSEPTYRSLLVSSSPTSLGGYQPDKVIEPVYLTKKSLFNQRTQPTINSILYFATEQPFHLVPTHFNAGNDLDTIVLGVNNILNDIPEISFEFDETKCKWIGLFIKNTINCKFEIYIYTQSDENFLLEINRLKGDCQSFHAIFNELKILKNESNIDNDIEFISSSVTAVMPFYNNDFLSDEEAIKALKPIIMMSEGNLESIIESSRIFCVLAAYEGMQQQLCSCGTIQVLLRFLKGDCQISKQNAIFAISYLSESCQRFIVNSDILHFLFELAVEGDYQTLQIRRECACILANLAHRQSQEILSYVGSKVLSIWISKIDSFLDDKLKIHAYRARNSLESLLTLI